jgi:tetratricopeptide (TPR) repeat protein
LKGESVSLPKEFDHPLAWLLALERMDTWVLKASIAIVVVFLAVLALWQLAAYLVGKLPRKPRMVKDSTPAPTSIQSTRTGGAASRRDDPEWLQKSCTALEDSLAELYLELAECWSRRGQAEQAAAALEKVLQICPTRHQAQLARERLERIGNRSGNPAKG